MRRRELMTSSMLVGVALPARAATRPALSTPRGPALLTVTGAITRNNRGPLDPSLDQLMVKQKVTFDKAFAFDFAALAGLPVISIRPTLEYDGKPHTLTGPLLSDVARAAGAPATDTTRLLLRAIDGYVVALSLADARRYRYIVAWGLDGQPMPLGGLGPLWAVFDADRFGDVAAKPLDQRFAACPWGLYHIEVQAG